MPRRLTSRVQALRLLRAPQPWWSPAAIVQYGVAILSVVGAVIVLWWMNTVVQATAHLPVFLCAIVFSARFGGFRLGMVAIMASALAFDFYFVPPTHSFRMDPGQLPRLVLLVLSGMFVTSLTAAQRRAKESLRGENAERERVEYLMGRVFESLPDGVAIIGRDYRYRRANPVYDREWRVEGHETVVGLHVVDVLGEELFEQIAKPYLDRCFDGAEGGYSGWFVNALGRRYVAGTCSPLRPHAGPVESALVIVRDLTEHMLAADALRATESQLAHVARVTTLGEVTASFAHELNQPLAAISNNANACLGLVANGRPDVNEMREALTEIVDDADRASAIFDRVRALARRSSPEQVPLRLGDVVDDVVALAASEASVRRVAIRTDMSEDLPVVLGDRIQLQQVLLNLIVNGMDAMSAVDELERKLEIRGRADSADGRLAATIGVEDRGTGLAEDETERLFEAFYTTKPHGMGLGLAISRSIIEAHGGRLWAESNRGSGATFFFRLPATFS